MNGKHLAAELLAHGWAQTGAGRAHIRLTWPDGRRTLIIPTDPTAPEYQQRMDGVLAELEAAVDIGVKAAYVLAGHVTPR